MDKSKNKRHQLALLVHISLDVRDKLEEIKKKKQLECLSDAIMEAIDTYHAELFDNS